MVPRLDIAIKKNSGLKGSSKRLPMITLVPSSIFVINDGIMPLCAPPIRKKVWVRAMIKGLADRMILCLLGVKM